MLRSTSLLAVLLPTLAYPSEVCLKGYANAVTNVHVDIRRTVEYDYLHTVHCEKSGELRQSSAGLDLTIPIKQVAVSHS